MSDQTSYLLASIDALELRPDTREILARIGVRTLGNLFCYTEADLLRTKLFGHKSLGDIRRALQRFGLELDRGAQNQVRNPN